MCTLDGGGGQARSAGPGRWRLACKDYKALVRRFGEGGLPENQQALLRDHLAECEDCRRIVRLLDLDDAALGAVLLGPPPPVRGIEPPRRLARVLAFALAVLLLALAALFVLYRQLGRGRGASADRGSRPGLHLDSVG